MTGTITQGIEVFLTVSDDREMLVQVVETSRNLIIVVRGEVAGKRPLTDQFVKNALVLAGGVSRGFIKLTRAIRSPRSRSACRKSSGYFLSARYFSYDLESETRPFFLSSA